MTTARSVTVDGFTYSTTAPAERVRPTRTPRARTTRATERRAGTGSVVVFLASVASHYQRISAEASQS